MQALAGGESHDEVFTVTVTDDQGGTDSQVVTVNVTGTNDNPTITGIDNSTYTENAGAQVIDSDLIVGDVDDANLESAKVEIANYVSGQDVLTASTGGTGILVSFNTTTGVLELVGNASVSNYEAVLRTVAYENASENPDTTPRQIKFTVFDGKAVSASTSASITVIAENDGPTVTSPSLTIEEGETVALTALALGVEDVDDAPARGRGP